MDLRMTPRINLLTALALALIALAALGACDKGADACPDVVVSESCTLRCARKTQEAAATQICGKSLMVKSGGTNEILQRDTKRIEFRQLDAETCFEVDATGALTRAEDKKTLQERCEAP